MQESVAFFHEIEWPASGARVAGPVAWLRGWVKGKPGYHFTEVRATGPSGIHLGILGFPRTDLAAHFKSRRPWLPAEFVIGVPLTNGPAEVALEARDESGNWHRLQLLAFTVATDGAKYPRVDGELVAHPAGSATSRAPHLPFYGHLDEPEARSMVRDGQIQLFGWLLHETQPVRAVFATLDGLVFNLLESALTDEALAEKVPQHPAARHARLRGGIDAPPTLTMPACLRVYAELADGSVHLCFARPIEASVDESIAENPPGKAHSGTAASIDTARTLAPLPSGRPRRLLFIVRSLQPDDATLRALDVARYLIASGRWAVRLFASEDGPLHAEFVASECAVQLVNPCAYFAAGDPAERATARLALAREIWWRHLDGVGIFDGASTWAGELAQAHHIPIFHDPADSIAWFAPSPLFTHDPLGVIVAPVRGDSSHGAGILLQAAAHLERHPSALAGARQIIITDNRDSTAERCFAASLALQMENRISVASRATPQSAAAVVCPGFNGHPHRALLSAIAAGIPLIATRSALLSASFGPNEINWVTPGNPLALAHAIVDVLANPVASERRAVAATRIVQSAFAPREQLARWEKLLAAAVSGRT